MDAVTPPTTLTGALLGAAALAATAAAAVLASLAFAAAASGPSVQPRPSPRRRRLQWPPPPAVGSDRPEDVHHTRAVVLGSAAPAPPTSAARGPPGRSAPAPATRHGHPRRPPPSTKWEFKGLDEAGAHIYGDRCAVVMRAALLSRRHSVAGAAAGRVRELVLPRDNFGPRGVAALVEGLAGNTSVEAVRLGLGPQAELMVREIAGVLATRNRTVHRLYVVNVEVVGDGLFAMLANLVRTTMSLQVLAVGGRPSKVGVAAMARALALNRSLRELVLERSEIDDAGATLLADALRVNASLRSLNLSWNKIGSAGAAALASALLDSPASLRRLELWGNPVGADGLVAIGESLGGQCKLETVRLSGDPRDRDESIETRIGTAFGTALRLNRSLLNLTLYQC
ncbi:hypothetical protein HK405_015509, partial [Cladochytrium tenue]